MFIELIAIRWLAVEINLFAHLRNFVLVSCLFGLGLGYALGRPRLPLLWSVVGLTLLVLAVSLPTDVSSTLHQLSSYVSFADLFSYSPGPSTSWGGVLMGLGITVLTLTLVGSLMVPMGQMLASEFDHAEDRLQAYWINLAGSVVGVAAYTGLSASSTPPTVWLLIGLGSLWPLVAEGHRALALLCTGLAALAPFLSQGPASLSEVHWSPYQRVQLFGYEAVPTNPPGGMRLLPSPKGSAGAQAWLVEANGVGLWILNMSPQFFSENPWLKPSGRLDFYDLAFRVAPNPPDVLIMGAGGGNDTAAALRGGAGHVDAVELDPYHAELGRRLHPEKPYQDPRVQLHITDARNFLKRTTRKYDLICFSLLDNVNLTSNYSNLRLDSFVYTRESFEEARNHLKPGGMVVVYAGSGHPFAHRMGTLLSQVFGVTPFVVQCQSQWLFQDQGPVLFLSDPGRVRQCLAQDPELRAYCQANQVTPEVELQGLPTDDWPYWTLPRRALPSLQVVMSVLIVCLGSALVGWIRPAGSQARFSWNFFFLGAGFMLMEAQVITRMALLFGCTWTVNAFIIAGVLCMVMGANLVVMRARPIPARLIYAGVLLTLLAQWLIPPERFLGGLSVGLAVAFYTFPVFFAGLAFSQAFRDTHDPGQALAANLFGSVFGGMLDILSYALGMRALVVVVMIFYLLAAVTSPDVLRPAPRGDGQVER